MKAKWRCSRGEMKGRIARQCGHEQFVVCTQLKDTTFAKMAKMLDCCMGSQQLTIPPLSAA
jgi:hypothetical protein